MYINSSFPIGHFQVRFGGSHLVVRCWRQNVANIVLNLVVAEISDGNSSWLIRATALFGSPRRRHAKYFGD